MITKVDVCKVFPLAHDHVPCVTIPDVKHIAGNKRSHCSWVNLRAIPPFAIAPRIVTLRGCGKIVAVLTLNKDFELER